MAPPQRTLRDISRSNRRRTLPSPNTNINSNDNANRGHATERRNSLPVPNPTTNPIDPSSLSSSFTSPRVPVPVPEDISRLTQLYNEQVRTSLQLRIDYNDVLADKELADQNLVDAEEEVERVRDEMERMREDYEDEVRDLRDRMEELEDLQKNDEKDYENLRKQFDAVTEENIILKQVIAKLEGLVKENNVKPPE